MKRKLNFWSKPMTFRTSLAIKLVSIVVHMKDARGPTGQELDLMQVDGLLADPEINAFVKIMGVWAPLERRKKGGT